MMAGLITTCLYADPVDLQQAKAIAAVFMANGQQPSAPEDYIEVEQ